VPFFVPFVFLFSPPFPNHSSTQICTASSTRTSQFIHQRTVICIDLWRSVVAFPPSPDARQSTRRRERLIQASPLLSFLAQGQNTHHNRDGDQAQRQAQNRQARQNPMGKEILAR
jgi:hypothetical protein